MSIEAAIVSLLSNHAGLAALMGSNWYAGEADQGAGLPYGVHGKAKQERIETIAGWLNTNRYTMHLEVAAASKSDCIAVHETLRAPVTDANPGPLIGYRGTVLGVGIIGIFEKDSSDAVLSPIDGKARGVFVASMDIEIVYAN